MDQETDTPSVTCLAEAFFLLAFHCSLQLQAQIATQIDLAVL
jgi:hypothetical protein